MATADAIAVTDGNEWIEIDESRSDGRTVVSILHNPSNVNDTTTILTPKDYEVAIDGGCVEVIYTPTKDLADPISAKVPFTNVECS